MAAGNLDVLQEVLKFATERTKDADTEAARHIEDEDMQWLKEALASLGEEEAKRLTSVHDVLIQADVSNVDALVEAIDFMCDFVDSYDSAQDWIESGGADLVQHLFALDHPEVLAGALRLVAALCQNHIPVQKLLHTHALWPILLAHLSTLVATSAPSLPFAPDVEGLMATALATRAAATPMPSGAAATGAGTVQEAGVEHAAWTAHNKAAVVRAGMDTLIDVPGDAAAALALAGGAGAGAPAALIGAISAVVRSADTVESDFVALQGPSAMAVVIVGCGDGSWRVQRKALLVLRALLMSKPLSGDTRAQVAAVPGIAAALAGALRAGSEPIAIDAECMGLTDASLVEGACFLAAQVLLASAVATKTGGGALAGGSDLAAAVQEAASHAKEVSMDIDTMPLAVAAASKWGQ